MYIYINSIILLTTVSIYVCVGVRVCTEKVRDKHTHTHTYIYIFI